VALSDEEQAIAGRLEARRSTWALEALRLDAYYDGEQRLEHLGLAVPPELRQFTTIVNWPGTAVDSLEERIDLEGFRLPGQDEADDDLWNIWQANDLDEESQLGHLDTLIYGRSFIAIGSPPDTLSPLRQPDVPLVTVESPREMAAELDPRTREVSAAWRCWTGRSPWDPMLTDPSQQWAALYLPDQTIWLRRDDQTPGWVEEDRDDHQLGVVPVQPLVNRGRLARRAGRSEMEAVIPLTDAAARALTNAQLATEAMAVPQRYVLGATRGDFVDKDGNQLTAWESYFGAIWALQNSDAKVGQFTAADLSNFVKIVDHYAAMVSGLTGLPMRYFGLNSVNPPSADAIRADESRLVKRAERRQRSFGGSWERTMRIVRRLIDGDWNPDLASMETLWRDPATPTRAQAADAVVKLVAAGIIPAEAAWVDLGYSATRRTELRRMAEEARADPLTAQLAANAQASATPAPATNGAVPAETIPPAA
jgi:hypothetical protein